METIKKGARDFNATKLEFIRAFLNEVDENIVKEQITFYHSLKETENIPSLPHTEEELKISVLKAEQDYQDGIFSSMEEVFKKYGK
ncbi:hypothetical protein G5B30_06040 [Sphingobacterium sp. SGG-5]|uniref:hypothetical protein n=1 Tax=Sphingobacterium sp. SGG-5 TaxID=2710881 RepID=UPI0013EC43B3|nr:hypothetical protein [Sphingobacterium sp. SGG-5]NGM61479.1 hypothetical protein [Sphingobacterium sp. SGG-5]